jgi:hypothetical protein
MVIGDSVPIGEQVSSAQLTLTFAAVLRPGLRLHLNRQAGRQRRSNPDSCT